MHRAFRLSSAVLLLLAACTDERPAELGEAPSDVPQALRILVAQPDEYDAHIQEVLKLNAFLYRPNGEAATGETVRFEVMNDDAAGNPGGASLLASATTVDEQGLAAIDFRSGSVGDVDITVRILAVGSQEHFIVVHVLDFPVGSIEVQVAYEGPIAVGPVDVFVMPGENRCPYNAVRVPLGELAQASVPAANASVTFGPFLEGTELTLFARGMVDVDGRKTLGAQGCLDEIIIRGDETLELQLQMLLVPLNPVGSYDVQNHFDFTDAIPGTIGDVIRNLNQLFTDTGNWLIDRVQDGVVALARAVLGLPGELIGRAIEWIIERFQPTLAGVIDNWIDNSAPDWLKDFLTVGRDLLQIVNNLEVLSLMTFDKVSSDFQLAGDNIWSGIALYWRLDCAAEDPPSCGRHEFRIEDLFDTEYPIDAVWARFSARVIPYNGMHVNRHDVNLQYGRLILFVLNEMILPRIAGGARTLADALVYAFHCPDLARAITGDDGFWGVELPGWAGGARFGVDADDIEGFCEGAGRLLGGVASELISGLAVDSLLQLEGDCKLYEDNQDVLVDRIEAGDWLGNVRVGDDRGANNLTGDWRGCRRTPATDRSAPFTDRCPIPTE